MKINIYPLGMPLKHTFTISYDSRKVQKTLLLSLEEDGQKGWGEVVQSVFYKNSLDDMVEEVNKLVPWVENQTKKTPSAFYKNMCLKGVSIHLRSALDIAMHDLYAKRQKLPLWKSLGLPEPNTSLLSSFTIGLDSTPVMIDKMKEKPWPVYKVKMGQDGDMDMLKSLRKETDAVFRVDANGGWTLKEALNNFPILKDLGVELVEQPLPTGLLKEHLFLRELELLPIFADESCQVPEDVARCAPYFDGINTKLIKAGGITPNLKLLQLVQKHKMKMMMGCMVESSIGISPIAHLLGTLDYVDMDGALLLLEDPATGVNVTDKGCQLVRNSYGTGARLKANFARPVP